MKSSGTPGFNPPYTTPVNSPPASPAPELQKGFGGQGVERERSIALHEILSTEDLIAPKRLTLYKPEEEEKGRPLSVRPGMELRRVLSH